MQIGEQIDKAADYVEDHFGVLIRWMVIAGVSLLLIGGVFAAATSFAPPVGQVSANALYWSVGSEVGGSLVLGSEGCHREREHIWRCDIDDPGASSKVGYRVVVNGDCWHALRVTSPGFEGPMAKRPHGCVKFGDQVRPSDRLF